MMKYFKEFGCNPTPPKWSPKHTNSKIIGKITLLTVTLNSFKILLPTAEESFYYG